MTDVDSILDNATQWATESVTKPTIKTGQLHNILWMKRGIVVQKLTRDDQLEGVVDRNAYSVDSHDVWSCEVIAESDSDLENIIGTIYRILAEYNMTSTETFLDWQGGVYDIVNNVSFRYSFAILRKKSRQTEF